MGDIADPSPSLNRVQSAVNITYGPQIAIVGAGPAGTSILERLVASATQFIPKTSWLTVHVIDPYPPGAGKVWRTDQSRLLQMNSVCSQVTLFTDKEVRCDGPIVEGPTLYEWLHRNQFPLGPNDFPTRVQFGTYLRWVYDHVVENLPQNVRVRLHVAEACKLKKRQNGLYDIALPSGDIKNLSAVTLAQGHVPRLLEQDEEELECHARNNISSTYFPPGNPADANLSLLQKTDRVLLRGLGLCFFDYLPLLTEGRGGEFVRENCELVYKKSGREPKIYCFSRRGLPLQGRGLNHKEVKDIYTPLASTMQRFEQFIQRARAGDRPDFQQEVWPVIALEVELVYYRTLLRAHDTPYEEFETQYAARDPQARSKLLDTYNIEIQDRWDWPTIKRPYREAAPDDDTLEEWQAWLEGYLRENVRQAQLGNVNGPHATALSVLRDIRNDLRNLFDYGGVRDRQAPGGDRYYLRDKFSPLIAFLSIGPPIERIEQMIALMNANVLQVLKPNAKIEETDTMWRVGGVKVNVVIDARMPQPSLERTGDRLLKHLYQSGQCRRHHNGSFTTDAIDVNRRPHQIIHGETGEPNERLFAVGVPTEGVHWVTTTAPRPFVNSKLLLSTDMVARAALRRAQKDLRDQKLRFDDD